MKKLLLSSLLLAFMGWIAIPVMAVAEEEYQTITTLEIDKDQKQKTDKDGKTKKTKVKTGKTDCAQKAACCEGASKMKKAEGTNASECTGKKGKEAKSKEAKESR